MNYANQIRIIVSKENQTTSPLYHKGENDTHTFLLATNWSPLMDVIIILNQKAELNLWLYLQSWYGREYYDYSPTAIQNLLDISNNTGRKIREKFEHYGFLVRTREHEYNFVPYPEGLHKEAREKCSSLDDFYAHLR